MKEKNKQNRNKVKGLALLLIALLLFGMICPARTAMASEVKISETDYVVSYNNATGVLLSNKKEIGSEIGTEIFLTYTVATVSECSAQQQGIMGTSEPMSRFPYINGVMEYDNDSQQMLREGYTYFCRFEMTEYGIEYDIIAAKDDEEKYIYFNSSVEKQTEGLTHFGLWFDMGTVTAELIKVRCYDRNGNDLGVQVSQTKNASCSKDVSYAKNNKVNHSYKITVEDQYTLALSNAKKPMTNKVYMEYTVESSKTSIYQNGLCISQAPTDNYPFAGNGYLIYEGLGTPGNGQLLVEGASYIICMEKTKDEFTGYVQRTHRGKKEVFTFTRNTGEYNQNYNYYSLWFGEGSKYPVDFVLKDFKCYDSNNNNLGVQCNRLFTKEHAGELEDYTNCDAVYYCREDKSIIALYEEQKMKYTKGDVNHEGTYTISDEKEKKLTLSYDGKKEEYVFIYNRFKNADGKEYERLKEYKVNFVTGTDENINEQIVAATNGFVAMKPTEPKRNGYTFIGWYDANGKEYDFDTLVTESITLYAKWSEGEEYQKTEDISVAPSDDYDIYIAGGVGILILAIAIVGFVLLVRKENEKNEKVTTK